MHSSQLAKIGSFWDQEIITMSRLTPSEVGSILVAEHRAFPLSLRHTHGHGLGMDRAICLVPTIAIASFNDT
jgi:hypothetical protein